MSQFVSRKLIRTHKYIEDIGPRVAMTEFKADQPEGGEMQHEVVQKDCPKARFAMNRMEFGVPETEASEAISAPPYEFAHRKDGYDVYFNMFGIPESNIKLNLEPDSHTMTVFAQREKTNFIDQFLWVISLPDNADLRKVCTLYKKGVVQISFPKSRGPTFSTAS